MSRFGVTCHLKKPTTRKKRKKLQAPSGRVGPRAPSYKLDNGSWTM